LPPRGLSRPQAAEYVGVGVTKFDELVADGRMPPAKRIDGRKIWDRFALDESIAALADEGEE
jgi:predicted DNA-binding transcriptional regulator AlpA